MLDAFTDYPIPSYGDVEGKQAPIRKATILTYDRNKYCDVNQMWIQQLGDADCGNLYVAIGYNPRKDVSMVLSKPRTSYHETLQWVRKFCNSFSILP